MAYNVTFPFVANIAFNTDTLPGPLPRGLNNTPTLNPRLGVHLPLFWHAEVYDRQRLRDVKEIEGSEHSPRPRMERWVETTLTRQAYPCEVAYIFP
jgi:hypothetical protein